MTPHLPLWEETPEGVQVRVVYQIVMGDYHLNPDRYDEPTTRLLELAEDWRASGIDLIARILTDAAIWCRAGATLASWRVYHTSLQTIQRTPSYRYRRVRD